MFIRTSILYLTLIFSSAVSWSADAVTSDATTYRDAIKKAQALTLKQDRIEATKLLVTAIQNEPSKKGQDELTKTLTEISTLFYTEKAQKLFEYAKSLFRENGNEALEKFQEALVIEPNNLQIQLWMARFQLRQGKCNDAFATVSKTLETNPFYTSADLIKVQSQICLQKDEGLLQEDEMIRKISTSYPMYFQLLMAQEEFNKKNYPEAEARIQKAEMLDKNFPEIYFWKTHILEKQEKEFKDSAAKYVRGCKGLAKADYLKYEFEPRTCVEYKNFEAEYKSTIEEESKKDL
jgi:lipopolysaccharide biosynthesis regulator YciM